MCSELPLSSQSGGGIGDVCSVDAFAMPVWSDAERDGPVRRLLKDRGIAVVHHLIAVVLKVLAKVVELGPRFMTSGTGHAVLARKSRNGAHVERWRRNGDRGARVCKNEGKKQESDEK